MKNDHKKWGYFAGVAVIFMGLGIGLIAWTHPYCSKGVNLYISTLAIILIGVSLALIFVSFVKRSPDDLRHMIDGLGRKEPGKRTF